MHEYEQSRYAPPLKFVTLDSAHPRPRGLQQAMHRRETWEIPAHWNTNETRIEMGRHRDKGSDPLGCQSCSLRAFLRLRFRATASLTRFFSPGFR
jgi:hypothetical protein